jgi:hypothetical protein
MLDGPVVRELFLKPSRNLLIVNPQAGYQARVPGLLGMVLISIDAD